MTAHRWRIEPDGSAYCLAHGCVRTFPQPQTVSAWKEWEQRASLRGRYVRYYRDVAAEIKAIRRDLGWAS